LFVLHDHLARTRQHDVITAGVLHELDVLEADRARGLHFDLQDRCRTRRRTTDVERTHGELRARFADRLRRDNTDGLAEVDQVTATEVATVAGTAHAVACFAGNSR